MSDELHLSSPSGVTVYAIIRRRTDGYAWRTSTSTFIAWDNAQITNFDIPLTDNGGDHYSADFPTGITTAGYFDISYYYQDGASPATDDDRLWGETIYWDGTGAGTGTPPSGSGPSAGTVTVTVARAYLRRQARNAGDTTQYVDATIDDAIFLSLNDFLTESKMLKYVSALDVTISTATIDLSTLPSDWRPERTLDIRLTETDGDPIAGYADPLEQVSFAELIECAADNTSTGKPEKIAFEAWDTCRVWPTPDAAYKLRFRYWLSENDWTHGGASVTLRCPFDYLYPILSTLGVHYLQSNEASHAAITQSKLAEYQVWKQRVMGMAGNLAVQSTQRLSLSELRGRA